uniref:Uncharacterized protein n=1 Tax=Takifugu rubripes TaxID=31033 RepID=A0A3B5KHY5_TAKRU
VGLELSWVGETGFLRPQIMRIALVFTCSCPMEGKPGEGPEAMDVTFICPAIWPMLLVAILVAMETLLRFMPLLLYMLLFCWVNCGDVCCCENILTFLYLLPAMLPCGQPFMSGEP